MQYISIVQVLGGAILSMIAGFLWYSPVFFGKKWQEEMEHQNGELEKKDINESGKTTSFLSPNLTYTYTFSFIGDLISGAALLTLSGYSGLSPYIIAIICWFGFVVPVIFGNTLYEGKSLILFILSAGYRLVSLLLMATIFSIF